MQLRPSASSALGLLLLAACTIALVDASQSLIANRPAVARSHFSYAGVQGQIYAEPVSRRDGRPATSAVTPTEADQTKHQERMQNK